MVALGYTVYSPITHSYPMARVGKLPDDWAYWESIDRWYIERCEEVHVITVDGWKESVGVQAEIQAAKTLGRLVRYV
jgi:hypothetical protein